MEYFFLSDLPNNSKPGLLIISLRFFEIMADSQSSDNNWVYKIMAVYRSPCKLMWL